MINPPAMPVQVPPELSICSASTPGFARPMTSPVVLRRIPVLATLVVLAAVATVGVAALIYVAPVVVRDPGERGVDPRVGLSHPSRPSRVPPATAVRAVRAF